MYIHDATELAYKNGYKDGYEKAAREIFEEIESHLATNQAGLSIIRFSTLAELKKKYTDGGGER